MGKGMIIGLAAAGTIAAGTAYYVGPGSHGPIDTPPLLVDGTPEQVLGKVARVTLTQYLAERRDQDDLPPSFLTLVRTAGAEDEIVQTFRIGGDEVLVLHAKAEDAGNGQTALDVVAEMPESRFSRQPEILPYDLKVIAAMADLAATDYLSSRLNGHRLANIDELGKRLVTNVGWEREDGRAFANRVQAAFKGAYRRDVEAWLAPVGGSSSASGDSPMDWTEPERRPDLGADSADVYREEERERERRERESASMNEDS